MLKHFPCAMRSRGNHRKEDDSECRYRKRFHRVIDSIRRTYASQRFVPAFALVLVSVQASADHSAAVSRLVHPLLENEAFVGCVVGIVDGGQEEIHAYGEIHKGAGDPPDGDTIYEIGSITKAFTGTLLGGMVQRGEVKLDDPLQQFLPANVKLHRAKDQPIKLVDLASHTSGLPRLPDNFAPQDPTNPYADYTPKRMLEFLGKHQLRRPPGEYEYSNLGMGLLGYVLAQKARKTYEQLVVEQICEPLEMRDTRITLTPEQRKRLAPPYNAERNKDRNWDLNCLAGAGALRSTVNDMLKLAAASFGDDNRPAAAAIHEAWKPHYGKPGEIGVGLGWHIARDGVTRWHNGQTGGYSSALYLFPPKKLAVVVLCNTACEQTTPLAEKITQAALGMSPEPLAVRKSVDVDPKILASYEGTYALSLFFAITITLEDGKLMAQATGQEKYQVFPESNSKFFYKVVDAQISFEAGKDGKFDKLILHQNGQDMPGIKVPSSAAKKQ